MGWISGKDLLPSLTLWEKKKMEANISRIYLKADFGNQYRMNEWMNHWMYLLYPSKMSRMWHKVNF